MLYKLKSVARRGTLFGAAAALTAASFAPLAPPAYADALNPLTDRSLTLSSSAPGWENYDGSGNTTYAQPNSGANGQKTGNTFDFKVSSSAILKGMTFQYCTTSAGECKAPGDNASKGGTHGVDTATSSDLKVVTSTPTEVGTSDFATVVDASGNVQAVPGFTDPNNATNTTGQYAAKDVAGNFVVFYDDNGTWTQSTGWTMTASNLEDYDSAPAEETGQNNYITLANTATTTSIPAGTQMKVVFFGTEDNYIQNPGSGAFFVKINTYNSDTTFDDTTLVDGGVTVANVMNNSIRIQTKVLETMKFSVGTVDPNTLDSTDGLTSEYGVATGDEEHGVCDPILGAMTPSDPVNVLKLGDQSSESALSVEDTYATHSYWRLSSNSSAGATVYYSGVTLSNTVGDKIAAIGATSKAPKQGEEQFGLGLMNGDASDDYAVDYSQLPTFENANDNGKTAVHSTTTDAVGSNASWHMPQLAPLVPQTEYAFGGGNPATNSGETTPGSFNGGDTTTRFAFDETSSSIPVALATQDSQVVDCVTAKVRYIANIAATTPAGIYTTAVNYIAAPQY